MSNHPVSTEVVFHPTHSESTKRIWNTFWLLSVVTLIELGLGLAIYNVSKGESPSESLILFFKGLVCILTLVKAYYIVSIFMHLGDEVRNMIMTIVVPLMLFIWFIIAFLWDGGSWKDLRNTNGGSVKTEKVTTKHTNHK